MQELIPRQVVEALDRFIVGQDDAKRVVAVAIRNRWRRQQLPEELRREVGPKNMLVLGQLVSSRLQLCLLLQLQELIT